MIRFIISGLFLIVYLIISLPVMLFFLLARLFSKKFVDNIAFKWVKFAVITLKLFTGLKVSATGLENIVTDEGVLYVSNHLTLFDIIVLYSLMKKPTGFIAKKELGKIPVLSWLMKFVHCLFLDRKDPRNGLKMVINASENIKSGVSMVIFPEGTRSRTGELLEFKGGSFKIAEKAKCKVIPIRIDYNKPVFEEHIPKVIKTTATVRIIEPIDTKDMDRKEIKELANITHEKLKQ